VVVRADNVRHRDADGNLATFTNLDGKRIRHPLRHCYGHWQPKRKCHCNGHCHGKRFVQRYGLRLHFANADCQ